MAFDLQIAKIILGKDFQKIDAVIFRAFSCLAGHLEICLMWSLYGKLVNFVCNFVGNFSSRAALWCRYLSLDTCESSAHTHAFSDLSETSSESYTLAVQHLTRPGGNEQSEWFPFSYRGKRLQMCCLPLFFGSVPEMSCPDDCQALEESFSPCNFHGKFFDFAFHSVPAVEAVPGSSTGLPVLGWGKMAHCPK